jgi:hypothetical protein
MTVTDSENDASQTFNILPPFAFPLENPQGLQVAKFPKNTTSPAKMIPKQSIK